jgi:hypothetical protein
MRIPSGRRLSVWSRAGKEGFEVQKPSVAA